MNILNPEKVKRDFVQIANAERDASPMISAVAAHVRLASEAELQQLYSPQVGGFSFAEIIQQMRIDCAARDAMLRIAQENMLTRVAEIQAERMKGG